MPSHELFQALVEADVVVGHAGTGTVITALSAGKLPVLSPRLVALAEHVDGHQEDLARSLAQRGLAVVRPADEITLDDLRSAAGSAVTIDSDQHPVDLFRRAGKQ
jgi:UDP-N-acetylglucosamine transferase subunit ALG13